MNQRRGISIFDFVLALVKRKALIIGTTLLAVFITMVLLRFSEKLPPEHEWNYFPDTYHPNTKLMITWLGMAEMQASMGISKRSLGAFAVIPGAGNPYLTLITQLIRGNTILDQISEEFDLYSTVSRSKASVRGWLLKKITIAPVTATPIPTFSIISIGFMYTNKYLAYRIVGRLVELLHKKFNAITTENLTARKEFFFERMRATESEIERYKNELKRFQKEKGVIDIDRQAVEQRNLLAEKMVDLLKKELELRSLQKYFGDDNPRVRILRDQIEITKEFIDGLKTKKMGGLIPLDEIPELKDEYTVISQNLKIQLSIYERLRSEYEKVKLSEINSLDNIQIVEKAEIPENPVIPNRMLLLLTVLIATLIEVTIWALIKEYLERLSKKPGEDKKFQQIKAMLKRL